MLPGEAFTTTGDLVDTFGLQGSRVLQDVPLGFYPLTFFLERQSPCVSSSLLSLLPPSSGGFPTVPPTRVGLRPESGIPTLADRAPSAVGLVGVGLLAMLRYPGMANW